MRHEGTIEPTKRESRPPLERTIEITNFCPFACSFCSSDTVRHLVGATFLPWHVIVRELGYALAKGVEVLHISGGEPLFHREIGTIMHRAAQIFGPRNVILHTNLIPQIAYNARVLDGVKVHCLVTPDDVDEVHVLKRVPQGREARVPEVHCSRNWREQCDCDHVVVKPDGSRTPSPCRKDAQCPGDK